MIEKSANVPSEESKSAMNAAAETEAASSFIRHPSSFSCVTCSDEALECVVVRIDDTMQMAVVVVQGAQEEIDISLVDDVAPGDSVLVHGGVAISKV